MKSLQEKLKIVRDTLLKTGLEGKYIFHYERPKDKPKHWIVWMESGEATNFYGNDRKAEQQGQGIIDCFTQIEYDPLLDDIQNVLNEEPHIAWSLDFVDYEDETKLIHYQWTFRVA